MRGLQHMRVASGQRYTSPGEAYVEGDASSASYFLAGQRPRSSAFTKCQHAWHLDVSVQVDQALACSACPSHRVDQAKAGLPPQSWGRKATLRQCTIMVHLQANSSPMCKMVLQSCRQSNY